jgi:hypothetical protein
VKMEAIRFSEMSVNTISTQHHIPEDGFLHSHCHENIKFYTIFQDAQCMGKNCHPNYEFLLNKQYNDKCSPSHAFIYMDSSHLRRNQRCEWHENYFLHRQVSDYDIFRLKRMQDICQ